jgi:glycosyltransferase involved in cell wall biosynthesis
MAPELSPRIGRFLHGVISIGSASLSSDKPSTAFTPPSASSEPQPPGRTERLRENATPNQVLPESPDDDALNIVVVQSIGRTPEKGPGGGGQVALNGLMAEWSKQPKVVVWLLTNALDFGPRALPERCRVVVLPTMGIQDTGSVPSFATETLFSFLVQQRRLKEFLQANPFSGGNTVAVSPSIYPTEIIATAYVQQRLRCPAVAYVYHVPPPPWFHPTHRGSLLRIWINWVYAEISLTIAKVTGMSPLAAAGILSSSGWRFPNIRNLRLAASFPIPSTPTPPWADRSIAACYIGRIQESKGVVDLVRAWALVVQRERRARLIIAGRAWGPQPLGRIHSFIHDSGLSDLVEVPGPVSEREKVRLLEHSKLMVLPSYEEGWSLIAMEAAARGAIPVLYDLPAYAYLGDRCIRVPPGNIPALAESIVRVLQGETKVKPESASAISAWLTEYDRSKIASEEVSYFRTLTKAAKRGIDAG